MLAPKEIPSHQSFMLLNPLVAIGLITIMAVFQNPAFKCSLGPQSPSQTPWKSVNVE